MRRVFSMFVVILVGMAIHSQSALAQFHASMIGEVKMFAGNFAPRGWLDCNGQAIRADEKLSAILSSTKVPDMRKLQADMQKVEPPWKVGTKTVSKTIPRYIIARLGQRPFRDGKPAGGSMVGEIRLFAGNFAPSGWMFCEGQKLSTKKNVALFSLIGTSFGGDRTYYLLPDLRKKEEHMRKVMGSKQVPRHIICLLGILPNKDRGIDGMMIGEIRMFSTQSFAPGGWAFCKGQTLGIGQNSALYSVAYQYGGDGKTNFKLPDLAGNDQKTAKSCGYYRVLPFSPEKNNFRRREGVFAPRHIVAIRGSFPSRP